MDDSAVVSGLMSGDAVLLLQHSETQVGEALRCRESGGKANDSSADDYEVEVLISHDKDSVERKRSLGASTCVTEIENLPKENRVEVHFERR